MRKRLEKLSFIAKEEFSDILRSEPVILETKIRLYLVDGSFIDIRYPLKTEYSFHWQKDPDPFRVNTAPDHSELKTFPRHIHRGGKVKEDTITSFDFSPEDNLRRFLKVVREELKRGKDK